LRERAAVREFTATGERERKGVKCEGRKSYAESGDRGKEMVALAKAIKSRGGRVSLREVAAELEAQGYTTPSGERYSASAVATMVGHGLSRYK
jgi:hypothetical protein